GDARHGATPAVLLCRGGGSVYSERPCAAVERQAFGRHSMLDPPRLLVATYARSMHQRWLIVGCAVVGASCGSVETDTVGDERCEGITVETYCAETGDCRSLEE